MNRKYNDVCVDTIFSNAQMFKCLFVPIKNNRSQYIVHVKWFLFGLYECVLPAIFCVCSQIGLPSEALIVARGVKIRCSTLENWIEIYSYDFEYNGILIFVEELNIFIVTFCHSENNQFSIVVESIQFNASECYCWRLLTVIIGYVKAWFIQLKWEQYHE